MTNLMNLRGDWLNGYLAFCKLFKQRRFISSSDIKNRYNLQKAITSLYIFPSFFRGVHYIPSQRERKGQFIEKPMEFFYDLFNYVYGRGKWYWALSTAARYHGLEWSSGMILEIMSTKQSKVIGVFARVSALELKKSYRSKVLAKVLSSLGINHVIIHKGKKNSLKETKTDPEIGLVATKERLLKDIELFLPKMRIGPIRHLYRAIRERARAKS